MLKSAPSLLLLLVLVVAACPMDPEPEISMDAGEPGPVYDVDVDPVCVAGTRFTPGTTVYAEVTADWGLEAIGVQGSRLNVTDIDGDGWPDVLVRRGGSRSDDLTEGGTRHSWLLRNTAAGFEDVTLASGLLDSRGELADLGRPYETVAFADVDNDGDQDIFANHIEG